MIVIDVLLGIGDRHGEAAVRWTFEQLNRTYIHPKWAQPIENFVYSRKTDFGPPLGSVAVLTLALPISIYFFLQILHAIM